MDMKAACATEVAEQNALTERPWLLLRLDVYPWVQMIFSPPPRPEDPSQPPSKKDNFGRLMSYLNMRIDVEQPCIAMWSGRKLKVVGQEDLMNQAAGMSTKKEDNAVDTKGVLFLMKDLGYLNVKEVVGPRNLWGMTPLKWRTVSNQYDFSEISMQLMNYTLCHKSMCWWTLSEREESDLSVEDSKENDYVSSVFLDASKYMELLERLHNGIQPGG